VPTALPQVEETGGELPEEVPAAEVMATAFLWPLSGEVERGHAWDRLVYDRTMGDWRTHDGLDISGGLGAKVYAAADGVVEEVALDERLGTTVVLYHGGGLRSVYANLAATPAVQVGDEVKLGDVVGAIGTTAMAERGDVTHLHFAMSVDGVSVDPREYLPRK
jgi:murein DD-endopeptidase MepM/ murein hydrolase activator NlpD